MEKRFCNRDPVGLIVRRASAVPELSERKIGAAPHVAHDLADDLQPEVELGEALRIAGPHWAIAPG